LKKTLPKWKGFLLLRKKEFFENILYFAVFQLVDRIGLLIFSLGIALACRGEKPISLWKSYKFLPSLYSLPRSLDSSTGQWISSTN
jgi:hypothetical protein